MLQVLKVRREWRLVLASHLSSRTYQFRNFERMLRIPDRIVRRSIPQQSTKASFLSGAGRRQRLRLPSFVSFLFLLRTLRAELPGDSTQRTLGEVGVQERWAWGRIQLCRGCHTSALHWVARITLASCFCLDVTVKRYSVRVERSLNRWVEFLNAVLTALELGCSCSFEI